MGIITTTSTTLSNYSDEDEEAYSSEDYDSLSENVNVETNDFISEIQTSNSRSSTAPLPDFCQINKAFHNGRPSIFVPPSAGRKASMPTSKLVPGAPKSRKQSAYDLRNQFREAMGSMAEAAIAFGTSNSNFDRDHNLLCWSIGNGEDSPNKFQKQNFSEPPKTLGLRSISEDRQQASNSNPELIIKREAISEKGKIFPFPTVVIISEEYTYVSLSSASLRSFA
jgi:hypothetical protein